MLIKLDNGDYINSEYVTYIGAEFKHGYMRETDSLGSVKTGNYSVYMLDDYADDNAITITPADRDRIVESMGDEGRGTKKQGPTNGIDPDDIFLFGGNDRVTKMVIKDSEYAGVYNVTAEMLGTKEGEDGD